MEPIRQGFAQHFGSITSLRLALLFTFPALYLIGSALFLLSFFLMKLDHTMKSNVEHYVLTGVSQRERQGEGEGEGEEERKGKEG